MWSVRRIDPWYLKTTSNRAEGQLAHAMRSRCHAHHIAREQTFYRLSQIRYGELLASNRTETIDWQRTSVTFWHHLPGCEAEKIIKTLSCSAGVLRCCVEVWKRRGCDRECVRNEEWIWGNSYYRRSAMQWVSQHNHQALTQSKK